MKNHHFLWLVVILLAVWIFHVHYNRGVPVKKK